MNNDLRRDPGALATAGANGKKDARRPFDEMFATAQGWPIRDIAALGMSLRQRLQARNTASVGRRKENGKSGA